MLTKVETIPNPFVVYSLMNGKQVFETGDKFVFHLTLFGKAISYIHYFIHAVTEIENLGIGAERNKFKVELIMDMVTKEILLKDNCYYLNGLKGQSFYYKPENIKEITLMFDTPLRVKDRGDFTQNLSFHLLMRNILRRIAMIYEYYMDDPFEIDYKQLLEEAKNIKTSRVNLRWQKMFRYSSRSNRKLSIGGVLGSITYKGDLEKFLPFIYLGELLHIGKGCTLGLGHYSITKL